MQTPPSREMLMRAMRTDMDWLPASVAAWSSSEDLPAPGSPSTISSRPALAFASSRSRSKSGSGSDLAAAKFDAGGYGQPCL